ncbi:unnamed protein product, partial [Phaeothamnion confervicola]
AAATTARKAEEKRALPCGEGSNEADKRGSSSGSSGTCCRINDAPAQLLPAAALRSTEELRLLRLGHRLGFDLTAAIAGGRRVAAAAAAAAGPRRKGQPCPAADSTRVVAAAAAAAVAVARGKASHSCQ